MRNFLKFILPNFNILIWSYFLIINIATCSAAVEHFCAIQADNTVACWGLNKDGQAMPPSGTFLQISDGGYHSCGILTDKTVACWGLNEDGQSTPPSDTFLQISAGYWHNCGVRTDNTLACWGSNDPYWSHKPGKEDPYLTEWKHVETLGQAAPPSGTFLQVSAGGRHTCGVRTDHTVECWGSHLSDPPILVGKLGRSQSVPPEGEFSQVGTGLSHSCGIRLADQQAECWGGFENGRATPPIDTFYSQIRGGFAHSCGLKTDGTVVCFGGQDLNQSEVARVPNSTCRCPIPGNRVGCACTTSLTHTFSQILEMGKQACGVRTDNTVACWGYDSAGHTFPPLGLIVKSANPACLVYGVHNDSKQTQFFIANINAGPLEIYRRSEGLEDNYQIEALDIDRFNNQLYAASGEGKLYEVRNGAQAVSEVGELGFKKVEALSFHPDRSLWVWAQGTGLFQVKRDKNNELQLPGTVVIPYDGNIKIKDISWNTEGTVLYGVENLEQGNRLWRYDSNKNEANWICEDLMASLTTPINALETHPDNSLIFTFTDNKKLAFGVIDVSHCQITLRGEIATDYNQVKGIAWPDCTNPASVAIPSS